MLNASEMMEPRLSADFAARVLRRVDIVKARRRQIWRIAAVCAVASFSAAAIATYDVASWHGQGAAAARREPMLVAVKEPANPASETGVLDFLLPDATPLAQVSRATPSGSN